jgi:hypothetical protein
MPTAADLYPAIPTTLAGELQYKYGASFYSNPIEYLQMEAATNQSAREYLSTVSGIRLTQSAPQPQAQQGGVYQTPSGGVSSATPERLPAGSVYVGPVGTPIQQAAPAPVSQPAVIPGYSSIQQGDLMVASRMAPPVRTQEGTVTGLYNAPTLGYTQGTAAFTAGFSRFQAPDYIAYQEAKKVYAESNIAQKAVYHTAAFLSPYSTKYAGASIGNILGFTMQSGETVTLEAMQSEYSYKITNPNEPFYGPSLRGAVGSFESIPVQAELAFATGASIAELAPAISSAKTLLSSKTLQFLGKSGIEVPASVISYGSKAVTITPKIVSYGLTGAYGATTSYNVYSLASAGRTEEAIGTAASGILNLGTMQLGVKAEAKYKISQTPYQEISQIKNPELRQIATEEFQQAKQLAGLKQPPVKELDFGGFKRFPEQLKLPSEATRNILKENVVIGGSAGASTQQYGSVISYAESDIDAYVRSSLKPREVATRFADQLISEGAERISVVPGKAVVTYKGSKIAEFHPFEDFAGNIKTVQPWHLPVSEGITYTPEGQAVIKLKYNYARNVVGGFAEGFIKGGQPRSKDILRSIYSRESIRLAQGESGYAKTLEDLGIYEPIKITKGLTTDINGEIQKAWGLNEYPTVSEGNVISKGRISIEEKTPSEFSVRMKIAGRIIKDTPAVLKGKAAGERNPFKVFTPERIAIYRMKQDLPSRSTVLSHELYHFKYPGFSESSVLVLEQKATARGFIKGVELGAWIKELKKGDVNIPIVGREYERGNIAYKKLQMAESKRAAAKVVSGSSGTVYSQESNLGYKKYSSPSDVYPTNKYPNYTPKYPDYPSIKAREYSYTNIKTKDMLYPSLPKSTKEYPSPQIPKKAERGYEKTDIILPRITPTGKNSFYDYPKYPYTETIVPPPIIPTITGSDIPKPKKVIEYKSDSKTEGIDITGGLKSFKPQRRYSPSLLGIFSGKTISRSQVPKTLTGAEVRLPVRRKR